MPNIMNIGKGYKALITMLIKSVFIRSVLTNLPTYYHWT